MTEGEKMRRIADELEVRGIIARLAQLADRGDLEEYGSLFTEDAHWELRGAPGEAAPMAPRKGRSDIVAGGRERRASGTQGPGSHTRHEITTTVVNVNGDSATATSYLTFYKNTNTRPEIAIMTFYNDEFRRTMDGWRLASRVMTKE